MPQIWAEGCVPVIPFWPENLPDSAQRRMVTFTFRSHGGNPDAEIQTHSIAAFVVPHSPPTH